ncbi:hypothetical protein [Yersinia enterocolitica]|uniref:hypothetical protein n=1 Tax=Yersinia enterocolitica TaxID=630 RepID=UPI0021E8F791|nr:hypothetical protein [Yersinia enterocolitica]UYK04765.1 hypothetical protein N4218_14470 [Yersinia enterocolitica]
MKNYSATLLYLSFLLSVGYSSSSHGSKVVNKNLGEAINSCKKLSIDSGQGIYAARFIANYGDAYHSVTRRDYQNLIANLCSEGILAAEKYKDIGELELFLFSMRSHWINILGAPVESVETISRNYFRSIHGIKAQEDTPYPILSKNPTTEERVNALEKYANQKTLRGIPIKQHCERITKNMPNGSMPSEDLKKSAIQICVGVMTMNFTKNKHGIDSAEAMRIADNIYKKGTIEYRYLDLVTSLSFSESKQ